MNKEIELRAWDGRRMIYISDLSIGLRKSKKVIPYAYFAKDTFNGVVSILKHEVMEFIGLHDNRGVKIFEDDVVNSKGIMAVVKYSIQMAQFQIEWKDSNGVHRYSPICATYGDDNGYYQCDTIRVIGNIYQNSELINNPQTT